MAKKKKEIKISIPIDSLKKLWKYISDKIIPKVKKTIKWTTIFILILIGTKLDFGYNEKGWHCGFNFNITTKDVKEIYPLKNVENKDNKQVLNR